MSAGKNVGAQPGAAGQWLFRQEGLVLGPVPGERIEQMLFSGELDGNSEIAPLGESGFRKLSEIDAFKVQWARAEAKRRVDLAAAQDRAKRAKTRTIRLMVMGGLALVVAVGAAAVATHLAIYNPWKDSDALAFADISMDPPVITVARRHAEDEELIAYPGRVAAKTPPPPGTPAASKPSGTTPGEVAAKLPPAPVAKKPERKVASASKTRPIEDPNDPDGMSLGPQFDMSQINGVVASKQKTLYPCFVEEAKRTPGLAAKIPLEFVIGNDGRVAQLWVDHPQFKKGPLYECLLDTLQKWPFKAYEGERATVSLSFNIGKKR